MGYANYLSSYLLGISGLFIFPFHSHHHSFSRGNLITPSNPVPNPIPIPRSDFLSIHATMPPCHHSSHALVHPCTKDRTSQDYGHTRRSRPVKEGYKQFTNAIYVFQPCSSLRSYATWRGRSLERLFSRQALLGFWASRHHFPGTPFLPFHFTPRFPLIWSFIAHGFCFPF